MTTAVSVAASPTSPARNTRWAQLGIGIIAMIAIANLQYGWTLFIGPMNDKFHWPHRQGFQSGQHLSGCVWAHPGSFAFGVVAGPHSQRDYAAALRLDI